MFFAHSSSESNGIKEAKRFTAGTSSNTSVNELPKDVYALIICNTPCNDLLCHSSDLNFLFRRIKI